MTKSGGKCLLRLQMRLIEDRWNFMRQGRVYLGEVKRSLFGTRVARVLVRGTILWWFIEIKCICCIRWFDFLFRW